MTTSELPFGTRAGFVVETARRLHQYGTAAPRLEMAVARVGERLGLRVEVWSSPTAIILSASELSHATRLAQMTQVMRLPPGDTNLAKLCKVDSIADRVIAGDLDIDAGFRQLELLSQPTSRRQEGMIVLAFGIAAAMVATLLRGGWADVQAAGLIGLVIGQLTISSSHHPRLAPASDAISALLATLIAGAISSIITPVDVKTVVVSALIVLMPGLALTNAVRELSTQHLASGSARMAGALATLLKLTFGALAGAQIMAVLGWHGKVTTIHAVPNWAQAPALLLGAAAFAVLFQAAIRDWPLVMLAAISGYLSTRLGTGLYGPSFGVFIGGLVVGALSNLYARYRRRPGALVREPGIILLVPGSVGFSSISALLDRNVHIGMNAALLLISLLISLVAGLLFGDLLIGPRRSL